MPVTDADIAKLVEKVNVLQADKVDADNKALDRAEKSTAADNANETFHQAVLVEQAAAVKEAADIQDLKDFVSSLAG